MVAFTSLFLGLVVGVMPVELVVGQEVAAVEIRLDGRQLEVLRQAPWITTCDFGSELVPQRLEAVAFDAAGRELGRVSQWLNLSAARVATSIVLEPGRQGRPRVARLSWESVAGAVPESVTASLDGVPVAVEDPRRIVLPAVDESQLHILHVELEFESDAASRLDVTFGGAYVDEVSTENTALAIRATRKKSRPPSVADAQGWFLKGGEALRVIAIEKGTAEVVVVMDRPFPRFAEAGHRYPPAYLAGQQRLRFRLLTTVPRPSRGVANAFDLFPLSRPWDAGVGELYRLLTRITLSADDEPPRLNSAVAVAGLSVYSGRRRRAVVIVPGASPDGVSPLTPAQVRRYLGRLAVPVLVWNPGGKTPEHHGAWGEVRRVGSLRLLAAAFEELSGLLAEQWIVWLDGRHLPQDVELSPGVEGFALLR